MTFASFETILHFLADNNNEKLLNRFLRDIGEQNFYLGAPFSPVARSKLRTFLPLLDKFEDLSHMKQNLVYRSFKLNDLRSVLTLPGSHI